MKVLICQTRFGIGDCVIFLPYIHAIAKRYGPVTLLAKKSSRANEIFKYLVTLKSRLEKIIIEIEINTSVNNENFC